jgi:small ligand-binding sensory domain FIST
MLDERPALDCLKADAGPALAADLAYARRVVLAEQLASSDQPGREPSRLRNLAGIDLERGSVALPNSVALGDRIAFVARDARAAREDLNQVLDPLAACSRPPFGLYLSCRARGESLFGIADLELAYVERAFAGSPVLGLATPLQLVRALGDDGEAGHLLTHSAVVVFPSTG